nr:MAG TPA: hypothetical protein [Caudoviricetes sp.]
MLRKQWKIRLVIEKKTLWWKRKKEVLITYSGATLYQQMELANAKTDEEKVAFFLDFIRKNTEIKLSSSDELAILPNLERIAEQIIATAFSTKSRGEKNNEFSPYSSYLVFLVQELRIEPRVLMDYTLQEIEYLSEGLIRNLNAKTEEGQKQNRLKAQQLQAGEVLELKKEMIDAFLKS